MPVVAVISAKGGVGKTTVTANLCATLAEAGHKVLAIDLDPQNALRFHLALDLQACEAGLAGALMEPRPWTQVIQEARSEIALLPFGSIDDECQMSLVRHLSENPAWLGDTLAGFQLPPDTIVMLDTPPGPSVYLQQALRISHLNVVTILADAASFATLPIIERAVAKYCEPRADFAGNAYLVNQVDAGKRLNRDVLQTLRSDLGAQLLGVVHQDQAVCEALASTLTVERYAPLCAAAQDFAQCAEQLLRRLPTPTSSSAR